MRKIQLTRGKVALVDDDDYDRLNQFNWQAAPSPSGNWYARRRRSSAEQTKRPGYFSWMHQEVLRCGRGVDHLDGDGLNNQRHNLRRANQSINNQNKRKKANTTSRFIGVSRYRDGIRWVAQIKEPKGKVKHLGLFDDETEAARAYDEKVRSLYSGYVKTNFERKEGVS